MLRKDPVQFLDEEQCQRVIQLIERLIETLRSKQVAVDERHAPMLYSRFLATLLAKHKGAKEEPQPHPKGRKAGLPAQTSGSSQTPAPVGKGPAPVGHQSSPSIEIVPPQPDVSEADMQNDFGAFDPTPNPLSHQHQQQSLHDPTFSMLNI